VSINAKSNIIARLQKDILSLQGFKSTSVDMPIDPGFGLINEAFPNKIFPLAAIHEFLNTDAAQSAASNAFICCIISSLMQKGAATIWVSASRSLFPGALKAFDVSPEHVVFIDVQTQKEVLWVVEEALKCEGLAAVIGELKEINFTESRRLQLAVEKSRVTGFIVRNNPRNINVNACVSRWKISQAKSETAGELPGIGFPRWKVELLKIRNGKPGSWHIEWSQGKFKVIQPPVFLTEIQKRKAG
jgi:protein ImuA